MCGILALLGIKNPSELRQKALKLSKLIRHRGPDWNGIYVGENCILCHERLGIVDPSGGAQPLVDETGKIALTVNGEIYNHKYLRTTLKEKHTFKTASDCEVILHLYKEIGDKVVELLDGDFSFVLYDGIKNRYLVARDPIGITSLYYGQHSDGSLWVASELKALKGDVTNFSFFPPGHYLSGSIDSLTSTSYSPTTLPQPKLYYKPIWRSLEYIPTQKVNLNTLRQALENAVVKRMMSDVPYGVLLSGGLDSSLVASIVTRHRKMRVEEDEKTEAWWPQVHSFSIGLETSPDLKYAAECAKYLKTIHHTFYYTVQEGLDALRDVIWHLETFDVTTIRASTPMYFLARKIKSLGVKMVLSGEGADEIFGGYLYFDKAPDAKEFHKETVRRVFGLHYFDCLRANKSTAAWGVEVRVPFLDVEFLDVAMNFDAEDKIHWDSEDKTKRRIEKWVVRKAFDVKENPFLPDSILWRQKEQFSDGVGYGWIDGLKETAEKSVTDEEFGKAAEIFPENTPQTKEAFFYRQMFAQLFPEPSSAKTGDKWVPTWGVSNDPSGRVHSVHASATIKNN